MPKFRNVSPLGALDLALVGRVVEPGEVITVTESQAVHLAGQEGTWEPVETVTEPTPTPAPTRGARAAAAKAAKAAAEKEN